MRKSYKFRIYPKQSEAEIMQKVLNSCRCLYNDSLAERKEAYKNKGDSINYYDQAKMLTYRKDDNPSLKETHSQILQDVLKRLDTAYQNFFRRVKQGDTPGFPRFKGYDRYDSFTYPQSGWKFIGKKKLKLSKIGIVKIRMHRSIPAEAKIKTCTIKREADQWYVIFSTELPDPETPKIHEILNPIGIDVGIKELAVLSNGEKIANPKWLRESEKKMANEQRRLSRKRKGSNNRKKQKVKVQKVHRKITNQRSDFLHKVSTELVKTYDLIVFEDLKIKNMVKNHFLAKSIVDASWNQLISYTTYKAEEAGAIVELVDPKGTSQECSSCGAAVSKTLAIRTHKCPHCGLVMDRDENAARNILARSKHVAPGRCEFTPVEIFNGRSMKQDAPIFISG